MEELFETARNLDYSEPSIVANAIKEVRKCFPLFEYKVNTHDSKQLYSLSGKMLVPRVAKAVPVEIWLPLDFPRHPPILRVPLVRTMLINPSGHVNIIGNIEHVSLNQWNQDSRLVDLLYTLTVEFMDVFPVFELGHFNLPSKAKDVIFAVMRKYQRLKLFWDKHSPDGSKQTIELKLEGLIPLDKRPDIAVRIWLFLSFPQTAPDVYVIPGDNMALTPTVHLYKSGRVRHNYIKEWEYPTSNLTELLDQLVKAFSQNFPFQVLGEHGLPGNKQKLQQAKTLLDKLKISKKTKKDIPKRHKNQYHEACPAAVCDQRLATALPRKPIIQQTTEVKEFGKSSGLSENTIGVLIKNGFTTQRAILCMQEEDLNKLALPMAEFCLLRETLREKKQTRQEAYYNRTPMTKVEEVTSKEKTESANVKTGVSDDVFARAMRSLLAPLMVTDEQLTVMEEIGRGEFGVVFKGVLRLRKNSPPEDVAVKTVICSVSSDKNNVFVDDFCQEILQLRMLNHQNIVCLRALAMLDGKPHMVLPFMTNGDLRKYISDRNRNLTVEDLLKMALQVARGMKYLNDQSFVHGDLAARNCLLDSDGTVKVGDFGLARQLHLSEYFKLDPEKCRPLRWMAPESLEKMVYTLKSDVWSFGILMWELMTRGQRPYPDVENTMLLPGMIARGYRMACPPYTPQEIYDMMLMCWEEDQHKRPEFDLIIRWFEIILFDDDDVNEHDASSSLSLPSPASSSSTDAGSIHISQPDSGRPLPPLPPREPTDPFQMPSEGDVAVEDEVSELTGSKSDSVSGTDGITRTRPKSMNTPHSNSPQRYENIRHSTSGKF